jgi:hypothetical protein
MKRKPDWTKEEFEILLANMDLPDDRLASKLPGRSVQAIRIVRNGLHSYHMEKDISMLSQMMVDRLKNGVKLVRCPRCGEDI